MSTALNNNTFNSIYNQLTNSLQQAAGVPNQNYYGAAGNGALGQLNAQGGAGGNGLLGSINTQYAKTQPTYYGGVSGYVSTATLIGTTIAPSPGEIKKTKKEEVSRRDMFKRFLKNI